MYVWTNGSPSKVVRSRTWALVGLAAITLTQLGSKFLPDFDEGSFQVNVTLQLALQKHEDLSTVPLVMDLIDDPKEKAALRLIVSRQSIARPFAAPPSIPADRARALRDAFDATMKDADFLHEASQLELEVRPVAGIEVQALINDIYASPSPIVKRASEVLQER